MRIRAALIWLVFLIAVGNKAAPGVDSNTPGRRTNSVTLVNLKKQHSSVHIEPAVLGQQPGLAVIFEGTDDLHYYAREETAPAGYKLKVEAVAKDLEFAETVYPKWDIFHDPTGINVEVYSGRFTVFIPLKTVPAPAAGRKDVEIKISGIACTGTVCLPPFEKTIRTTIDLTNINNWRQISLVKASEPPVILGPSYPVWFAFGLAFLAGLAFNIMPCIWPVLPLIVMRIVEQAKAGRRNSLSLGLAFCSGILLFFAAFAGVNIVLRLFYATVLQLGDPFRNPAFIMVLAFVLVAMALFMFGVFTITVPSSISGRAGTGKGYAGALGMGFLAAILSTPCSFGILGAAFAWAQAQPLWLATMTIMIIGVGMASPYLVLTSMPGLLNRLPKAGRWMDLFKQGVGFILLVIAVWLLSTVPQEMRMGAFYFATVLGFGLWMWGSWVGPGTQPLRKWLIRIAAVALVVLAGFSFLKPKKELIDWHSYDAELIERSLAQSKPVLISFTADWCLSCKLVERIVFSRNDIAELIKQKGVVAVKADTTGSGPRYPATYALKNVYHEPGVPVVILLVPGEDEPIRWRGKFFAEELKKALERLPSK